MFLGANRVLFLVSFLTGSLFLVAGTAYGITDDECMTCHGDPKATMTRPDGQVVSIYVNKDVFLETVHGPMGCTGCHSDITELPHTSPLKAVDCGQCHDQASEYATSLHGKALQNGDRDLGGCFDCHGKHDIRSKSDPLSLSNRHNLATTCGRCHSDKNLAQRHMMSVADPSLSYTRSVHGRVMASGNEKAAVCTDCHGVHHILPTQDPQSMVNRANVPKTCGNCHAQATTDYTASIHGLAFDKGLKDAPNCTDCHGEHNIDTPESVDSLVYARTVSRETCPKCHDDEKVMKRYGVETRRQASYMDSYHGLASGSSSLVIASCTSCHGVHNILPSTDPKASTNKANLPETCGKCHKDAGPNFAVGAVHIVPTSPSQKVAGIVRIIYLWIIGLTLGGMFLHNLVLFVRHMINHLCAELRGTHSYKRFTVGQLIGHMVLASSFIVLAISGFALRYPDSWMTTYLFAEGVGLEARGLLHRVAGVVFVVLMAVHFLHAVFTKYGRSELWAMMFWPRDIRDAIHTVAYGLGLAKKPPRLDRYSYKEKAEYWGLLWGSVIMIITGFCMWYADLFLKYFPKIALDVAGLVHFYEAWLAVGTIIIWHFYMVMFDPKVYPMNFTWLTGRITNKELHDQHPLEYERIHGKKEDRGGDSELK